MYHQLNFCAAVIGRNWLHARVALPKKHTHFPEKEPLQLDLQLHLQLHLAQAGGIAWRSKSKAYKSSGIGFCKDNVIGFDIFVQGFVWIRSQGLAFGIGKRVWGKYFCNGIFWGQDLMKFCPWESYDFYGIKEVIALKKKRGIFSWEILFF